MKFEWEKWDVAAKTDYYPVNGVAQALYRIYQSQFGDLPVWHEVDGHVRKILNKCVKKEDQQLPGDPPQSAGMVLRTAVLLQLVHLGV